MQDAALLFAWQQHPETRAFARNPEPPRWSEHLFWLDRTIHRDGAAARDLYIALDNDEYPVGMVRLDYDLGHAEVSIIVAPGLRRSGTGTDILRALIAKHPGLRLKAFIKPENIASVRLFTKLGFQPQGDGFWLLEQAAAA